MLIRCPQCGTGFNLPEEKIPAKGAKVKCSACTHTFRVRIENSAPVFFYKKGEAPQTGETMIGAPIDIQALPPIEDEPGESTQFGIPARSKSAREGYNPFPLAGAITGEQPAITAEEARNDRTSIMGSVSEVEEIDDLDLIDDDDDSSDDVGDRTSIGAPLAHSVSPAPLRTTEDDDAANNATQAFGSGKLDLFDGEPAPRAASPPPIEIDPFGSAFDEPVGDVGLLMPSTPYLDEPVRADGLSLESSSEVSGLSEEDFLLGGGRSDFGDAASLVDNSFGEEMASFSPGEGVVDNDRRPRGRPITGKVQSLDPNLELEDIRDERPRTQSSPRRDARPPAAAPVQEPAQRERPAPRPAPAYVHQVGSTSPIRRTFDLIFIGLVVCVGFVALIAARSGGFIDFTRFGHMVEVAFTGIPFEPRPDWTRVVETPPPEPPPDEPLRIQNARALEKTVGDRQLLVVTGRVRNYSLSAFKAVKVRVVVRDGDKVLAERVHTVGQTVDRKKFGAAKTVDDVKASFVTKLPDVGKEGTTYFAIAFDDVPSDVVANGRYDYAVTVAD